MINDEFMLKLSTFTFQSIRRFPKKKCQKCRLRPFNFQCNEFLIIIYFIIQNH